MGHIKIFFCLVCFFFFIYVVNASEIEASCQNYPPPNFCPDGYNITANGTNIQGCINWICVQQENNVTINCQNYPPPNFCPDGYNIAANGTNIQGCINWICVQQENNTTIHYIVIDRNSSMQDNTTAYALKNYLENLLGDGFIFEMKYNENFSLEDFENRVTTFIYGDKALIINNGMDYGIIISDYSGSYSPDKCAITTYLLEIFNYSYFIIQRDSSNVSYTNLKQEMYKDCKNAGEYWHVREQTRYTVCCEGLSFTPLTIVNKDGICSSDQEHQMCSNCGNGICEDWENYCNCYLDCKVLKNSGSIFVKFFKWVGNIFRRN